MSMAQEEWEQRIREARFPMLVVYDHPSDFPDKMVIRLFSSFEPTEFHQTADTLRGLDIFIPPTFHNIPRHKDDDPVIVEVWVGA